MSQFWVAEGETMVLQMSNLVETFMATNGMHVTPHNIRECWPSPQGETPQQDLEGVCKVIVHRLNEVATHHPLTTAWDRFTFPPTEEKYWKEEVLLHYPGKILDVRTCMPGFKIMLQNEEGLYDNAAYVLKFEGHMLIYNPQKYSAQWVPMHGISAS